MTKTQQERARAKALESRRVELQALSKPALAPRGPQAQAITIGDLILLRDGSAIAAIQVLDNTWHEMKCKWWYRDDGLGRLFNGDKLILTGAETVDRNVSVGTFELEWFMASDNWGWISLGKHPDIQFHISQNKIDYRFDLLSDEIDLTDLSDTIR